MEGKYDFGGWATRAGVKCADGRTIMKDAFKHDDGRKVPLVWNHQHNDPLNVLGHAILEYRDGDVYAHCTLNDTEAGRTAKDLVKHGDVSYLSIFANQLKQQAANVVHGVIREVSLVLSGANPGALIDMVLSHSDDADEEIAEARIYTDESLELEHSDEPQEATGPTGLIGDPGLTKEDAALEHADPEDKTVQEIYDSLTDEQKVVVEALIEQAVKDAGDEPEEQPAEETAKHNDEEDSVMKINVFDAEAQETQETVLSHSDMQAIFADAKRIGSLKEAVLAHSITDIDYLFPDATNMDKTPGFITRKMDWVSKFMAGVHHTPFSRIKSMFANLTADEARAKGYVKGNLKVEEVFTLLKRTTTPTTVYKKQKLDRDDVVDIVDFDVVTFMKSEMRMMLDEEIARAALVGDGRSGSSDDKINPLNIRPIWTDDDLYTIKKTVTVADVGTATADTIAKAIIRGIIKSRKDYKGSGNPVMFTTEDILTDMLLMEDSVGRVIYDTVDKLKLALRVSDIITSPIMEGLTRTNGDGDTVALYALILNLDDYNIGADKGGAVNMFDDFDIDYNQQKYLIETRCSGALVKPYSAIAVELVTAEGE